MENIVKGRAWTYGDNIDTDIIIPARYLVTSEGKELAAHCMEPMDAAFAREVKEGDIMAAGNNFGCGSSREHAPIAIKHAGISCVVAKSFARIFYRNAINIGLPILECADADKIAKGDEIEIDFSKGVISNITKGEKYSAKPFPGFIKGLISAGGLANYVRERLEKEKGGQ
jgi:3-isopropylmalate/(R)-2-methylmalate dehydratase small subunit